MTTEAQRLSRDTLVQRQLRALSDASARITVLTSRIETEMENMNENIAKGQHCRDLNHQLPFDLCTALAKRAAAINALMGYDTIPEAFDMASKGTF